MLQLYVTINYVIIREIEYYFALEYEHNLNITNTAHHFGLLISAVSLFCRRHPTCALKFRPTTRCSFSKPAPASSNGYRFSSCRLTSLAVINFALYKLNLNVTNTAHHFGPLVKIG